MLLTGCAGTKFATLTDGACKAFPRPAYQIKGATRYDQKWADETTEVGISGCGWKRPVRRPAYLNPMPVKAPAAAAPSAQPAPLVITPTLPPKKPSLIQRLRHLRHKI
jgi:hypothetical protein